MLQKIIDNFAINTINPVDDVDLLDLGVSLESATPSTLVFYRLYNNEKAIESFQERLLSSCVKAICVAFDGDMKLFENFKKSVTFVVVSPDSFIKAQEIACDSLYPNSLVNTKIVGITGTNGKTSTVCFADQIVRFFGKKSATIGTLGVTVNGKELLGVDGMTSPPYVILRKVLSLLDNDLDIVFVEVSSHALAQDRLYNIKFDMSAWISFSQDHLDYHKDINKYFSEKIKLYTTHLKPSGKMYIPRRQSKLLKKVNDYLSGHNICSTRIKASTYELIRRAPLAFEIEFIKDDFEVAAEMCQNIFDDIDLKRLDLFKMELPKGRFNCFEFKESLIIVDSAHTPDAIENVLSAIKKIYKNRPLVVLFGCGGDRDRGKRKLMARAVMDYADKVYVTSDNTRTEDPDRIIKDVFEGIEDITNCSIVIDRREAIAEALTSIKGNEVLVLAGRGHEHVWHFKGEKIWFSDYDTVKSFIGGK